MYQKDSRHTRAGANIFVVIPGMIFSGCKTGSRHGAPCRSAWFSPHRANINMIDPP
jgi:hypothetical protein